ncbi:MAG: winged helix-turn-helix domain-containing protein [Candidatus Woesearchaeota archaeon]|nr:winged helix-turn-helix domain-containing protein [Candidatus Woesearchaeota archaeon]
MGKRSVLWYVFVGSRGGETRMCIIDSLMRKPKNPRELSVEFELDYSTIRHSLRVLEKNRIIYSDGKKYGAKYMITPEFDNAEYEELQKCQTCTRHKGKDT